MMSKKGIILGITFLLITVGLSGCTEQDPSSGQSETIPPTTESLESILTKAETIQSMYYEVAMSIDMDEYGTQTVLLKIWQKKPYFKQHITSMYAGITTTIVVIQRPEGTYVYDAAQGAYVLTTTVPSYVTALQYLDSEMLKDLLNNQSITDFETEIIDGKLATILEYTIPLIGEGVMTMKVWIWNAKGVPLKAYIDMTMEKITMTMQFIFSNYSFEDIPDSMFDVS